MKFKIGDKVRVLKTRFRKDTGRKTIVISTKSSPYGILYHTEDTLEGRVMGYYEDELELLEQKKKDHNHPLTRIFKDEL